MLLGNVFKQCRTSHLLAAAGVTQWLPLVRDETAKQHKSKTRRHQSEDQVTQ